MPENIIKSVSSSSPDGFIYQVGYCTGGLSGNITSIKEEQKPYIKADDDGGKDIVVYRCYDKNDKLLAEIESNAGLIITYQ